MSRFYVWLTWRVLPRRLIMWCAMRVMAEGCTGTYYAQDVDELTAIEALRRWENGLDITCTVKLESKQ